MTHPSEPISDGPAPSGDRTADVARLAEALWGANVRTSTAAQATAAAILLTVDAIADERAAEALEEAADYWDRPTVRTIAADLRDRARARRNRPR